MHELTDKGYKDNGLIDRIIFVYPSSQEISDWQDEENAFTTFDKYSSMWEKYHQQSDEFAFYSK